MTSTIAFCSAYENLLLQGALPAWHCKELLAFKIEGLQESGHAQRFPCSRWLGRPECGGQDLRCELLPATAGEEEYEVCFASGASGLLAESHVSRAVCLYADLVGVPEDMRSRRLQPSCPVWAQAGALTWVFRSGVVAGRLYTCHLDNAARSLYADSHSAAALTAAEKHAAEASNGSKCHMMQIYLCVGDIPHCPGWAYLPGLRLLLHPVRDAARHWPRERAVRRPPCRLSARGLSHLPCLGKSPGRSEPHGDRAASARCGMPPASMQDLFVGLNAFSIST